MLPSVDVRFWVGTSVAVGAATLAACGLVVDAGRYHVCEGAQCDADASSLSDAPTLSDGATDASSDASDASPSSACDASAPFGPVVKLTALDTSDDDLGGYLSADAKRFYFARKKAGQGYELYSAPIESDGGFGAASVVTELSVPDAGTNDFNGAETADGLTLFFMSGRQGGGSFVSRRAKITDPWGAPELFQPSPAGEVYPIPGWLYEPFNFYLSRMSIDGAGNTGAPELVDDGDSGINIPVDKAVMAPVVTPDQLHLYFSSYRSKIYEMHIFSSDRDHATDPWKPPVELPNSINQPAGSPSNDSASYVTPDNCTLYFSSSRAGTLDMYKVSRP